MAVFNYALALHGSVINNKSAPLPVDPQVRAEVERFLRRLGYRLLLKELKHPDQATAGGKLELAMKWQNVGSAPCYRPYRLAYRLTNDAGDHHVLVGDVTVDKWLPGEMEPFTDEFFRETADLPRGAVVDVADTLRLPETLSREVHTLSIAVVGEECIEPVVQLGIKNRSSDGWYSLSALTIR
jgi:hypothetical protein